MDKIRKSFKNLKLSSKKSKNLENEEVQSGGGNVCPSCRCPYDFGKKRKLIDSCGHESCYTCLYAHDMCSLCSNNAAPSLDSSFIYPSASMMGLSRAGSSISSIPTVSTNFNYIAYNNADVPNYGSNLADDTSLESFDCNSIQYEGDRNATPLQKSIPHMQGLEERYFWTEPGKYPHGQIDLRTSSLTLNSQELKPPSFATLPKTNNFQKTKRFVSSQGSHYLLNDDMATIYPKKNFHGEEYYGRNMYIQQRNLYGPPIKNNLRGPVPYVTPPPSLMNYDEQWILKPLYFEIPQRDANSPFIGRCWLFEEILQVLLSTFSLNKGVLITGSPGVGKTSIILKMVEHSCFGSSEPIYNDIEEDVQSKQISSAFAKLSSMVVAYQFCQIENLSTCIVPEFVHSIAAQLAQCPQLQFYNEYLNINPDIRAKLSLSECSSNPDESFTQGILEPLCTIYGNKNGALREQLGIILVDGLYESESHFEDVGNSIGRFLKKHISSFPPWLKIICSANPKMTSIAEGLPLHVVSLDAIESNERIRKDMLEYISYRIFKSEDIANNIAPTMKTSPEDTAKGANPIMKFTNYICKRSLGCFLFLKMTLDLIEKGHLVIKSSSFNVLPVSLAELFLLELNLKFQSIQSFEAVSSIFSVCCASQKPMTLEEIFGSITSYAENYALTWSEFIERFHTLSCYLISRSDDSIMFYHSSFREWLVRRPMERDSKKFLCDPRIGHIAIGLYLSKKFEQKETETVSEIALHILKSRKCYDHVGDMSLDVDRASKGLDALWRSISPETLSSALSSLKNVFNPSVEILRFLLSSGASPHSTIDNFLENVPVIGAFASEGNQDVVKLLLDYGASVDAINSIGITPLMLASINGHVNIVYTLIENGAVVNKLDQENKCALVHASECGQLEVIEAFLSCDWNDCCEPTFSEAAQLSMITAASNGHSEVLEYFLGLKEVRVNFPESLNGETGLCASAASGQKESCEILIRHGGCSLSANRLGSPPLHLAVKEGHVEVAKLLLNEGAHIDQMNSVGKTPMIVACEEGHLNLVHMLARHNADLAKKDKDGISCLGWACIKGNYDIVVFLVHNGCIISQADNSGLMPLDLAICNKNSDIVCFLLEKGALVENSDNNGMKPLDRAISYRSPALVQCFLKKGAKLGPSSWELAYGKPEIMLLLLNKLLEDGNTLFRSEKLQDATYRYQYALKKIPNLSTMSDQKLSSAFQQLQVHLLLNLTRCHRKTGNFDKAIDLANKVISIDPNSFEAYYAKAKANRESGLLNLALENLTDAIKIAPSNREIRCFMAKVKDELSISEISFSNKFENCGGAFKKPNLVSHEKFPVRKLARNDSKEKEKTANVISIEDKSERNLDFISCIDD